MQPVKHLIALLLFAIATTGLAAGNANAASFDDAQKEEIEQIVTDYLLENPDVIRQVFGKLREEDSKREQAARAERANRAKQALAENKDELLNAEDQIVFGNPDGDVTIVEFLDYNCGYCKQAFGSMLSLVESDKDLRFIVKEWPVLGPQSMEAALVAMAVTQEAPEKYWDFHKAMMTLRGTADKESALRVAEKLGLSRSKLEALYEDKSLIKPIEDNYRLAEALQLTGTPGFVVGDEVIPGFVPAQALQSKLESVRSCGSTTC
ncbi:Protein-disulfide isomerase [Cohaesibacter sp. ES.047]|uniref:DsbA family protein n=1 Tax=Cohaesibacter sp. ES.047 TaxID=1798205 RepID=UPI000BB926BC|nr:DsbA family protein [Cohaesibacter sp. ES.047]SNY93788.1 Protein-disulfide isomerase [Cohaesibacter sp. ES.047]